MIKVIYSDKDSKIPEDSDDLTSDRHIFLAGPTPRSAEVKSWRPEAIQIFESIGFDGTLIVPEPQNGIWKHRNCQIDWEQAYLQECDAVMFWVPRNMQNMPGLTTNIEFGMYLYSGRMIFGAPGDAEHVWYMQYCCQKNKVPTSDNLLGTCWETLSFLNKSA
jgi:hypothetical protein